MRLINRENEPTEPYKPGVYMLTGINGIGKSTVVDAIAHGSPETVPLHASHELRRLFGDISREELELLTPEEKLSRMVVHFTTIFDRSLNDEKAVIMDTHLLVPIRKDDAVLYEDIWSHEYASRITSMAMLSANPESVRRWRLEDEVVTGRKRNGDTAAIAADQEMNIAKFKKLYADGQLPSRSSIIENQSEQLDATRLAVERVFRVES